MKLHTQPSPRRVAVAIPYRIASHGSEVQVCLVSSRKHSDRWVLPKGGIEAGEGVTEAAVRELWEEAGLSSSNAQVDSPHPPRSPSLTTIPDHKPHPSATSAMKDPTHPDFVPRAIYQSIEIRFPTEYQGEESWPEEDERRRMWVGFQQACQLIAWRKDVHSLLLGSSLNEKEKSR